MQSKSKEMLVNQGIYILNYDFSLLLEICLTEMNVV